MNSPLFSDLIIAKFKYSCGIISIFVILSATSTIWTCKFVITLLSKLYFFSIFLISFIFLFFNSRKMFLNTELVSIDK